MRSSAAASRCSIHRRPSSNAPASASWPSLDSRGRYADDRIMKRVGGAPAGRTVLVPRGRPRARCARSRTRPASGASRTCPRVASSKLELTPREREIAALLIDGLTSKLIGKPPADQPAHGRCLPRAADEEVRRGKHAGTGASADRRVTVPLRRCDFFHRRGAEVAEVAEQDDRGTSRETKPSTRRDRRRRRAIGEPRSSWTDANSSVILRSPPGLRVGKNGPNSLLVERRGRTAGAEHHPGCRPYPASRSCSHCGIGTDFFSRLSVHTTLAPPLAQTTPGSSVRCRVK